MMMEIPSEQHPELTEPCTLLFDKIASGKVQGQLLRLVHCFRHLALPGFLSMGPQLKVTPAHTLAHTRLAPKFDTLALGRSRE